MVRELICRTLLLRHLQRLAVWSSSVCQFLYMFCICFKIICLLHYEHMFYICPLDQIFYILTMSLCVYVWVRGWGWEGDMNLTISPCSSSSLGCIYFGNILLEVSMFRDLPGGLNLYECLMTLFISSNAFCPKNLSYLVLI